MKFFRIYPSNPSSNEALSVCFTRTELMTMGVPQASIDFEPAYMHMTEFEKVFHLWRDPFYLSEFFENNSTAFDDAYWTGISIETFVSDVVRNSQLIFSELGELIGTGRLLGKFHPLDVNEELNMKRGYVFKVKAKYGYISHRMAFRIYGVLVDRNTICITGGAIKVALQMKSAVNTSIELKKMEMVSSKLSGNQVFDRDSFADFLAE